MGHAYTPGLTVTEYTGIIKERILPLKGDVLVKVGDRVKAEDVVARAQLPGEMFTINLSGELGVPPEDLPRLMLKKRGDPIKKGELLAQTPGLLGLFRTSNYSKVDGTISIISTQTGQVIVEGPKTPVEIRAYVDGVVSNLIAEEGAVIQAYGALIQGIMGIGGEERGILEKMVSDPYEILTADRIDDRHAGKILVGGSMLGEGVLEKAVKCGCKGVITGGIDDADLKRFLGYEIGVAITGSENKGITLIVTDGYGRTRMADRTFKLLSGYHGSSASINGTTQIRAGVMRPEIIVTCEKRETQEYIPPTELSLGSSARVIRAVTLEHSHLHEIGKIVGLPAEPRELATGSEAMVAEVEVIEDGKPKVVEVALANLELV